MRRNLCILFVFFLLAAGPLASAAWACPMCKLANETQSALPKAYQASILFMLGVPATVAAGFGVGFYRLSRNSRTPSDEELAAYDWNAAPEDDETDQD
jgi:hypothetical protein